MKKNIKFLQQCFMIIFGMTSVFPVFSDTLNYEISDIKRANKIDIRIDCFSGIPGPSLLLTDSAEIHIFINDLKMSMQTERSFEQIPRAANFSMYRGILLKIYTGAKPRYFKIYKDFFIDYKHKKCFFFQRGFEGYLVQRVLESSKSEHKIKSLEQREALLKAATEIK